MSVDYCAGLYYGIEVSNDWVQSLPEEVYTTLREDDGYLHRMNDYTDSPVWIFGIRISGCNEGEVVRINQRHLRSTFEKFMPCANRSKELGITDMCAYYVGCSHYYLKFK